MRAAWGRLSLVCLRIGELRPPWAPLSPPTFCWTLRARPCWSPAPPPPNGTSIAGALHSSHRCHKQIMKARFIKSKHSTVFLFIRMNKLTSFITQDYGHHVTQFSSLEDKARLTLNLRRGEHFDGTKGGIHFLPPQNQNFQADQNNRYRTNDFGVSLKAEAARFQRK